MKVMNTNRSKAEAANKVQIQRAGSAVAFNVTMQCRVEKEGKWYVANACALDIASQGTTESAAQKNLVEAVSAFLQTCYELGTIDTVLKGCGFQAGSAASGSVSNERTINVPLNLFSERPAPVGEAIAC